MTEQTIAEARKYLEDNFDKEIVFCPCCDQLVKLYKRKFNNSMARDLITLYHLPNSDVEYYHLDDIVDSKKSSREISRTRWWGVVKEKLNNDKNKRNSGFWKITDKGKNFVKGTETISSHIFVYNNNLYELAGTQIKIQEALGVKFDYEELMKEASDRASL